MKSQKSIIVRDGRGTTTDKLDGLLEQGWKVVQMCPMPSATNDHSDSYSYPPTCLVIIEKDGDLEML